MSQKDISGNGVSRISAGKKIRRGEKSVLKDRRSVSSKLKTGGKPLSGRKEDPLVERQNTWEEEQVHIDVVI